MGAPSPPKPPSPYEQANAQSQANEKAVYASAEVNAVPQTSPFGSVTYDYRTVTSPEYDDKGRVVGQREYQIPAGQQVQYSPELQALYEQGIGFGQRLGDKADVVLGNVPTDPFSLDQIGTTDEIGQTLFDRQMAYLRPELEDQFNAQQALMSERGIPIGSEIWQDEMRRFETGRERSMNQLARDADIMARNERQTQIQNALLERNLPFQEFSALQGNIPNYPAPQAQPLPNYQIQAPPIGDYFQQNYQNQLAAHQSSAANSGALLSGALGVIPALFSDERLKEDKKPVSGEAILAAMRNVPVSEWQYTQEAQAGLGLPDERITGPMAQDVNAFMGGSSPSMIDLADMVGKQMAAIQALDKRTDHLEGRH